MGVGVQRCGTSWWYRMIAQHPQVASIPGRTKELHYFDRFPDGSAPADIAERYCEFFPRPPGWIAGEWTPRYMYDYWSLQLLHTVAPAARILVLLRDPIERYLSGVARLFEKVVGEGQESQLKLLGEALQRGINNRHLKRVLEMSLADALHRGLYRIQLKRVLDMFPPERVLVLQYERCLEDTATELERTCRFLGLEAFERLPDRATSRRRPPNPKPLLSDQMRAELVHRLEDDVAGLARLCPDIDLRLWPNFRHLAVAAATADSPSGSER